MSSQEVGPEWILSSFTPPTPGIQDHINELVAVARRIWPRIQAYAVKEQPQRSPDEMIEIASDVWERSEEHTSELQSRQYLVCRLLLEKKKRKTNAHRAEGRT